MKNFIELVWDKLKGIKYGNKTIIEVELNSETSLEKIQSIINRLDFRFVLDFYDAFYNLSPFQKPTSRGDSGAFTEVIKNGEELRVRMGNHGGFKNNGEWLEINKRELIDRIFKSREYNGGKMRIESRIIRKQWRKTDNGKVLYAFYHDISDLKIFK